LVIKKEGLPIEVNGREKIKDHLMLHQRAVWGVRNEAARSHDKGGEKRGGMKTGLIQDGGETCRRTKKRSYPTDRRGV